MLNAVATAIAAMPSLRPIAPSFSFVVALMLTIGFATVDGARDVLPHRGNMRRDLRFFGDDCCIDVEDAGFLFRKQFAHLFQNFDAADAAN